MRYFDRRNTQCYMKLIENFKIIVFFLKVCYTLQSLITKNYKY